MLGKVVDVDQEPESGRVALRCAEAVVNRVALQFVDAKTGEVRECVCVWKEGCCCRCDCCACQCGRWGWA